MSQSVTIFVRNDNDSITYVGDWSIVQASTVDSLVNSINGQAFSPTLHSTTTPSSFIFPYEGSSVSVIGVIDIANVSQSNQDFSWTCTVDGIPIDTSSVSSVNDKNIQTLCAQGSILDGAHKLVVNVTSKGTPFYLDNIQYNPSQGVPLYNSLVRIENSDPGVDFISGWEPLGIRNGTTDPEGLVNVTFIGVQLAWYGYIPFSKPHTNTSSGEFSVDGQPYISFPIPGLQDSFTSTLFNQLLFTTPMLDMGSHVLSAKYTGGPGQSPFTFEYLVVTNGSFSSTNTTPTNSIGGKDGNPTSFPASFANDANNSSHVGSIVGGVVGGVVGIAICTSITLFWFRSRRKKGKNSRTARGIIEPFPVQPHFVSQAMPSLVSDQTAELNQESLSPHYDSQTSMFLPFGSAFNSSNNSASHYAPNPETLNGSMRPLPTLPQAVTRFIRPRPQKGSMPIGATANTINSIHHEDSGIRFSQPSLTGISVEVPPTYSPS